ncbi:MAG: class IIb bacteriocin, lactobin A/cerein 7B family [Firmicutes bacterium]|nr:class IIb bacteriocin, lactobin A/cerein 7B family [Bacillota bacterium]
MSELDEKQLRNISGGGLSFWGVCGIVAAVVFVVGVLDGIARPVKCD